MSEATTFKIVTMQPLEIGPGQWAIHGTDNNGRGNWLYRKQQWRSNGPPTGLVSFKTEAAAQKRISKLNEA